MRQSGPFPKLCMWMSVPACTMCASCRALSNSGPYFSLGRGAHSLRMKFDVFELCWELKVLTLGLKARRGTPFLGVPISSEVTALEVRAVRGALATGRIGALCLTVRALFRLSRLKLPKAFYFPITFLNLVLGFPVFAE